MALFVLLLGARERRKTGVRATRVTLSVVHAAVDAYRADHERKCPVSLAALKTDGYLATDALDAWGVHGVGGALGAILTGVFASKAINAAQAPNGGWLIDGNFHQVVVQFYDVGAVFAYCAVGTFIILKVIDLVLGLRVPRDVEIEGLDINLHGEVVHD